MTTVHEIAVGCETVTAVIDLTNPYNEERRAPYERTGMTENTTASGAADAGLHALADRIEEAQGRAICISVEGADYLREALAASAPVAPIEPFGWVKSREMTGWAKAGGSINLWRKKFDCDTPVFLASVAPEAAPVAPAPQPAVPDGFVLVPVEPTPEMVRAAYSSPIQGGLEAIYANMLAAAPKAAPAINKVSDIIDAYGMTPGQPERVADIPGLAEALEAAFADGSAQVTGATPPQQGEYLPTGNPEADRVLGRLNSSDPDFDDCAEAAALIYKMATEAKGPDGFATWKDAAIAARGAAQAAPAVTAQGQYYDAHFASSGHRPYFLPFSARAAIAARHGTHVIKEFNALVADVVSEFMARHLATPAAPAPVAEDADQPHGFIKPDTGTHVYFYEQDFYVLSNFSAFTLYWDDVENMRFDTSEAAYHWEKFPGHDDIRAAIINAPSAHEAFKVAERNKAHRRPDWDDVKVDVMRRILRAKVEQHEYVRRKLLATGDRILVEDSWRDNVWGWGPNRDGQNLLGKLWMEVRDELRAQAAQPEGGA